MIQPPTAGLNVMIQNIRSYYFLVCCFIAFPLSAFAQASDETKPTDDKSAVIDEANEDSSVEPSNPFPDAVAVPPGILDGGTEWLNTSGPVDLILF